MNQKLIMIPTKDAESWKALLAEPEKHWKAGYSAMSAAISWEKASGIPSPIAKALDSCENLAWISTDNHSPKNSCDSSFPFSDKLRQSACLPATIKKIRSVG